MADLAPHDALAQLRIEVESLRLANAAIQQQMGDDAIRTDAMLRALEQQADELQAAYRRQNIQVDFTRRVMNTSSALIILLDAEGRIREVNRRFLEGLQVGEGDVVGRVLDDWMAPEEQHVLRDRLIRLPWTVHSHLFELMRGSGAYGCEHRLRRADGSYRDYWVEASPQADSQGKEEGAVVCATDITALKRQRDALSEREKQLREAQKIAQLGRWEVDLATRRVTHWSDELLKICELTQPPALYDDCIALVHPDDRHDFDVDFCGAVRERRLFNHFVRLELAGGRIKWVELRGLVRCRADGVPECASGTMQDITAQRQADEQIGLAARVFENSLNGVVITDPQARILKVNSAFTRILGYQAEEVVGKTTSMLKSSRHDAQFYLGLWETLKRTGEWQGEIWDRRKDGEVTPLWQSISAVRDARGEIVNYIGIFYDLSDQKRAAAHIHHLAYYDALTDLPNRQSFNDSCEQALKLARRAGTNLALLFLDLDRFKAVNDTLGHPVGDELLRIVSQRLKRGLRQSDIIARLGGDEFIVLAQNISGPEGAGRIATKILAAMGKPFSIDGHTLDMRASVGISCFPGDGDDSATLIKHADLALYKAKEEGRDQFCFYEAHLTEKAREKLFLETELRAAIKQGGLSINFQPQFDLANGRLVGSEVLARWRHPDRGMIEPTKFIAIAEESGLIVPLGEWVLREACIQAELWRRAGLGPHRIAVNVSGLQLERDDFVAAVARILAETGLPSDWLELEVTETYMMRQPEKSVRVLEGLRGLGLALALDDFGTGQSSLSYLKRLPVQTLKIDRSFITDLPFGENEVAITRAIVALGHSLRLQVLAEGVETPAQADFLRGLGCDRGQGYLYSRPVDAATFENILRKTTVYPSGADDTPSAPLANAPRRKTGSLSAYTRRSGDG
ncbi:GGDEF domain-containing protein [Rhodoblastus sphagnicola]|uniref:GGDEF domain-containing protein n=1 Tax=Rhodoblastus sphagnicola TaxID=333368 RepID=A0A2S6N047_9HYPH|nr:EAL domain-containing protein [Rhodoblastus sphagnicola]MBB4198896.1 diguanylate cyclase (GGDEF)-like protein/PAS domain S-box-containing protein [Rhodoblastus sphagnicola]PPQ27991.1 GGDEF domain-containing protein [Rhodoblastus sphagnicola]